MKYSHTSMQLDKLINKAVTILFYDGKKETGVLKYPDFGNGYILKGVSYDTRFYKSHVKKVSSK